MTKEQEQVIEEIKERKKAGLSLELASVVRGENSNNALYRRGRSLFKSWQAAVEAAGFEYIKPARIPNPYKSKEAVCKGIMQHYKAGLPLGSQALRYGKPEEAHLYRTGIRLYGSWKAAIEAAGISYSEVVEVQNPYPTKQDVIKEIRRRYKKQLKLNARGLEKGPDKDSALLWSGRKKFGGWREAIEAAGISFDDISLIRAGRYQTPEAVIAEIQRRENNGLPVISSKVRAGEHADYALISNARKFFGSWTDALSAAGLDTTDICRTVKYPDKQDVIDGIQKRAREGLPLHVSGLRSEHSDRPLYKAGCRLYGSWEAAIQAAGLDYNKIRHDNPTKYPSRDAVITGIIARIDAGLPVNSHALRRGDYPDESLFNAGKKEFGQWVYALLAASSQCSTERYLVIKSTLRRVILSEIKRRCNSGLSLEPEDLKAGTKEEAELYKTALNMFGSWRNAVNSAV